MASVVDSITASSSLPSNSSFTFDLCEVCWAVTYEVLARSWGSNSGTRQAGYDHAEVNCNGTVMRVKGPPTGVIVGGPSRGTPRLVIDVPRRSVVTDPVRHWW